jgi:hypothetical protein
MSLLLVIGTGAAAVHMHDSSGAAINLGPHLLLAEREATCLLLKLQSLVHAFIRACIMRMHMHARGTRDLVRSGKPKFLASSIAIAIATPHVRVALLHLMRH